MYKKQVCLLHYSPFIAKMFFAPPANEVTIFEQEN